MHDSPATTGDRLRRLMISLALPWLACGGLLWALVGLTPRPCFIWETFPERPAPGLTAEFGPALSTAGPFGGPRHELSVGWNTHVLGHPNLEWTERGARSAGFVVVSARSPLGRSELLAVRVWWLLPAPLLWTGINLWQWVRQAKPPATGPGGLTPPRDPLQEVPPQGIEP